MTAALLAVGLVFAGAAAGEEPVPKKKEKKGEQVDKTDAADKPAAETAEKTADDAKPDPEKAAPAFELKDTNDKTHKLADHRGKWVVLEWINHGCPFVKKHYKKGHMQALQAKYTATEKVVWLSICSSAEGKQGHMSNEDWNRTIEANKSKATAVLIDADGKVGKLYDAKVTPTMVVINPKGEIVYEGAIDSIRSADSEDCEIADNYVAQVLDAGLEGKESPVESNKAYG
jgi:glutathione peroxidase-family protein